MAGNYEQIYHTLVPRLANCDFLESAQRLGMELLEDGSIRIPFLGRAYCITKEGAFPVDGAPADVNTLSVLLYYVLSKGSGEPKGLFVPLFRLSGMPEGRTAQHTNIMHDPLVRVFGSKYAAFGAAAAKLGGVCEKESGGRHDWALNFLPKIPARVVFYEADEEFPAEVQVLLDEAATRFLEFECLAFLVGCFVRTMIQTAQDKF